MGFREFQQWLVNARINTAKCFDVPQNLSEASSSLVKIQVQHTDPGRLAIVNFFFYFHILSHIFYSLTQEFLSDRDQGQSKLNAVVASGELVSVVAAKDRVEAVRTKMSTAREDWKNLMSNLHSREAGLQVSSERHQSLTLACRPSTCSQSCCVFQNLLTQMKDFEANAEPLQECLNVTELAVQESSTRLHDLTAKKMELNKLQVKK